MSKVIAFSGSPFKGGSIEKGLDAVLAATGEQAELIRLYELNMKPCTGCKKCAATNRCVHKDDINPILEKIIEAEGIVIGAYPSFSSVNAVTKIFIERLWPLRHNHMLTKGKVGASVVCGNRCPVDLADYFEHYFKDYLHTRYQGALDLVGTAPCLSCGYGKGCEYGYVVLAHGPGTKITPDMFRDFNNDEEAKAKARRLGEAVGRAVREAAASPN